MESHALPTEPVLDATVDLRTGAIAAARTVDALIPLVQRHATRAALPRVPHLELQVGADGAPVLRFVVLSSR